MINVIIPLVSCFVIMWFYCVIIDFTMGKSVDTRDIKLLTWFWFTSCMFTSVAMAISVIFVIAIFASGAVAF